jgi:HisJ family histidinol phosphate phosphatase
VAPPFGGYFNELERCHVLFRKQGLEILSGVELGNPQEHESKVRALRDDHELDVVIASLHWLHGKNIQMESCFAGRRPSDVYADYFSALGEMSGAVEADNTAHFDRILWRAALLGCALVPRRIETPFSDALATIAWRQKALEINTRYLRSEANRQDVLRQLLSWFRQGGVHRVVVSSDAHGTWQLGANVDLAYALAGQVGLVPLASLGLAADVWGEI